MLGLAAGLQKGGSALLTYVKDNLKLYLDFKSNKSETLKFPCEGSTYFVDNDYIDIGDDTSLDITGNITLSCWVKPTVVGVTRTIFGRDDGTNRNYFFMCNTSNQFNFSCFGLTDTTVLSSTTFSVGNWYHLMGTYDGARLKLYINGVLETDEASTGTINNTDVSFAIGAREAGMDRHWDGYIANVGLWSRALSAEEINSIMRKNYSQLGSVEKTSLVSWWALDDVYLGSTTNASDDNQSVYDTAKIMEDKNGSVGSNLVPDGEFESGVDNWTVVNGTISLNSDGNMLITGVGGTASARLNALTLEVNTFYLLEVGIAGGSDTSINIRYDDEAYGDTKYGGVYSNASQGTNASPKNVSSNFTSDSSNTGFYLNIGQVGDGETAIISHVKLYKVTSGNYGSIFGATTTTSVYGGHAPVLPRAVDVAREGEAEAIGDGSASFDGTDDRIDIGNFTNLNAVSSFTITAWMKRLESNDAVTIEKSADGNNRTGINLYTDGSVYVNIGEGGSAYGGVALAGTDWNHVAVVFDGSLSGNANRAKIYTNGILQTLSFTGTIPSATDSNTDSLYFGYDPVNDVDSTGNISQVGIWRGALTQAQIQSVMESTSYDKIPASVKSTLTEKVTNGDFSSTSGWTEGTGWDINTTTGVASADGTAGFNYLAQSSIFNSNLHKMTITIDSCSNLNNAGIVKNGSVVNFNTGLGISSVGTHTIYFTNSTANLSIYSNGETTTISNISIEEVTNDLVGYWALDESKHLAPSGVPVFGAVVDSTTGENLGDELFTGWINTDCATFSYNSSTKELTATCDGLNQEVHASFSIESGKVYRFEFTTGENYSNTVFLRGIVNDTSLEVYSSSPEINRGYFGTENTYAFYVRATATGTRYVGFRGNSGLTIHITNFSIKEADSNMGLLI